MLMLFRLLLVLPHAAGTCLFFCDTVNVNIRYEPTPS